MYDASEFTAEDLQGLAELAALDLRMAKLFAARAEAEEDPDLASSYARTYQRSGRSYRQCLALKARLVRGTKRGEREDAKAEAVAVAKQVQTRRQQATDRTKMLIYTEYEEDDAKTVDHMEDRLEAALDVMVLDPHTFANLPVETIIQRLRQHLDLKAVETGAPCDLSEPEIPETTPSSPSERSEERGEGRERGDAALPPPRRSSQDPPDRWT